MNLPIFDENSIEALDLPGRRLRWLVNEERANAQHCSMCVITVDPGETVRPTHSHPNGEEVVYSSKARGDDRRRRKASHKGVGRFVSSRENPDVAEQWDRGDEGSVLLCSADQP
jgi:hypothetical protein